MTPHPKAEAAKNRDHTLLFAGSSTVLMIMIGLVLRSEPAFAPPAPTTISSEVHDQLPVKKPEVVMNEWN